MIVGVPKETKVHEYRVGLVPSSAAELVKEGHKVLVEANEGAGMGASNLDYERVGAQVVTTAEEVFSRADMVVKVKEP